MLRIPASEAARRASPAVSLHAACRCAATFLPLPLSSAIRMRAQRAGTEKADGLEGRVSHPPATCDYAATPVLVRTSTSNGID
jgi:hypothetical protein